MRDADRLRLPAGLDRSIAHTSRTQHIIDCDVRVCTSIVPIILRCEHEKLNLSKRKGMSTKCQTSTLDIDIVSTNSTRSRSLFNIYLLYLIVIKITGYLNNWVSRGQLSSLIDQGFNTTEDLLRGSNSIMHRFGNAKCFSYFIFNKHRIKNIHVYIYFVQEKTIAIANWSHLTAAAASTLLVSSRRSEYCISFILPYIKLVHQSCDYYV